MRNAVTLIHEFFVESNEALSGTIMLDYMRQSVDIAINAYASNPRMMKNLDYLLEATPFVQACQRYMHDRHRELQRGKSNAIAHDVLASMPQYVAVLDSIVDEIINIK